MIQSLSVLLPFLVYSFALPQSVGRYALVILRMLQCVSSSTHSRLYVLPSQNRTWSVTPSGSRCEPFAVVIEHARCVDGVAIVAARPDTAAS